MLWGGYKTGQSLQQVWFAGAHSDVGGGYEEVLWSTIALTWMAAEAKEPTDSSGTRHKGLDLDWLCIPHIPRQAGANTPIHHQLHGKFFQIKSSPRSAILERSLKPKGMFFFHQSVCDRFSLNPRPDYEDTISGETQSLLKRKSLPGKLLLHAKESVFTLFSAHISRTLRTVDTNASQVERNLRSGLKRCPIQVPPDRWSNFDS